MNDRILHHAKPVQKTVRVPPKEMELPMSGFRSIGFLVLGLLVALSACTKDPNVVKQQYLASADSYLSRQKYQEAVVEYGNALKADPLFGEAHLGLAKAHEALGDSTAALREVRARRGPAARESRGPDQGRNVPATKWPVRGRAGASQQNPGQGPPERGRPHPDGQSHGWGQGFCRRHSPG